MVEVIEDVYLMLPVHQALIGYTGITAAYLDETTMVIGNISIDLVLIILTKLLFH